MAAPMSMIYTVYAFCSFILISLGQQCDPNCSGCTTAGLCVSDTLNRCQFNFITFTCEPPICGADCSLCTDNIQCNDDSFCYFLPDTERCVPDNTCSADCSLCQTEAQCINGAGGSILDPICIWNGNECKGSTCNTNCAECLSPNECAASLARPFGCQSDPNIPEVCIPVITNAPTNDPTPSPTPSPVSPITFPLFCGDRFNGTLSFGAIQTFLLEVPYDLDTLIISTCEFITVFESILTLLNANGSVIAFDEFGCADDLGRAKIEINDVLAGNYTIELSSAIGSNGGKYHISIDCITAPPTARPTDIPTWFPSIAPTVDPTANPTVSPTQSAECGDVFDGSLGADDEELIQFALGVNTNRLVITTCFVFTNVTVELVLSNVNGFEIAFDIGGCGDASVIDYQSPLDAGDYIVTLSPAQSPGSGVYRIAFQCFTPNPTAEPTANPTKMPTTNPTLFPTKSPTGNPSQNPTKMPTIDPTMFPTNIPSNSPTRSPTSIPTIFPTNMPTLSPSFIPTINPTSVPTLTPTNVLSKSPTNNPTIFPTLIPTLFPTNNPTSNPSFFPTISPTNKPTDIPSLNPTLSPTTDPSTNPALIPTPEPTPNPTSKKTLNPTLSPSLDPSLNPTSSPFVISTVKPTKSPTFKPTRSPTTLPTTLCPECPYNVSLVMIGNVSIENCPSSSSSSESIESAENPSYDHKSKHISDSESGRRRLLFSKESDSDDSNIKCVSESNSESSDGTDSLQNSESIDAWYREKCGGDATSMSDSDDSSGAMSGNGFMTEVCVKYDINDLTDGNVNDCGFVKQIFLGLCENNRTDFNSSTIDENDLNALIVGIEPNELNAIGYKNDNGDLGILVEVPSVTMISEFELCLGNVSVDSSFNQEKETIDIGQGSVIIQHREQTKACPADGLPCLNFVFDEPCPDEGDKVCKCDDAISELTMVYTGECPAKLVNVYHGGVDDQDGALCSFQNVISGTEIICGSGPFDAFRKQTFIEVIYDKYGCNQISGSDSNDDDDSGECLSLFRTDCSRNIVGTQSEGCDALSAVAFRDVNGAFCDKADVFSLSDSDDDGDDNFNALIGEKKENMDTLQIFESLNPFIKITVISLLTGFGCFIIISCYMYTSRKLSACTEQMHVNVREDIGIATKVSGHQRIQTIDFDETEMMQTVIDKYKY